MISHCFIVKHILDNNFTAKILATSNRIICLRVINLVYIHKINLTIKIIIIIIVLETKL